jgi:riboflavin kinase/FMN adenylyltransferase
VISITLDRSDPIPPTLRGGAVSVGNFDGLHRGHAAILSALVSAARTVGGPAVVVSFDPPPLALLAPQAVPPLLTTPTDRALLMARQGADHLLLLRTTPELLSLSAEAFFNEMLRDGLAARALVEGANFRFGRGRTGDVALLETLCRQADRAFTLVPPVEAEGAPISSSRIRIALAAGDVHSAARWLGRPYAVRGRVTTGARRGRTLGFPTANLDSTETVLPGDGVYAVRVRVGRRDWPAAANVGPNPTFGEGQRRLEAHLIGFTGDLYGQVIVVEFVERLRDTRPFSGVNELVEQLHHDVEQARALASGEAQQ